MCTNLLGFTQIIQVDSTFNQRSLLTNLFDDFDTITGIKINGTIQFHSDSSLVRVLFIDNHSNEFMICEAYPLIINKGETTVILDNACDETCYLNSLNPSSIRIEIIDATLYIENFYIITEYRDGLANLQYNAKRAKDSIKIEAINENIKTLGMDWTAGDNSLVRKYYWEKKLLFGTGYNLGGYDYYTGGIFEFPWPSIIYYNRSDLVPYFDWRNRHDATIEGTPYYDGDILGTGWITNVKNQNLWSCGACYAFSTVGLTEAFINLYFNQHLDFDLSEQDIVCNAVVLGCSGGIPQDALNYIKTSGIRTEYCMPYQGTDFEPLCDEMNSNCETPDTLVSIEDFGFIPSNSNEEQIRETLINHGPLNIVIQLSTNRHSVFLVGYFVDPDDQSIIWIYKDSGGESVGDNGFIYTKNLNIVNNPMFEINYIVGDPAVNIVNHPAPEIVCRDADNDGYCNWGIGNEKPDGCPCENNLPDCNDNNPFVGPYDENKYCSCLLPYDPQNPETITGNQQWLNPVPIDHDIIISSGASLTIKEYVYFAPGAKVIVQPGGTLTIDGGTLTKACDQPWEGIEVWGNPDLSQLYPQYQGHVYLMNQASIQNAKVGITTSKKIEGEYIPGFEGGLVIANESSFKNNIRDIEFYPYQNIHPYSGDELNNFSYFTKCTFESCYTDSTSYQTPDAHIYFNGIKGIKVNGCSFKFLKIENCPVELYNMGTGILGFDASFYVLPYCDDNPLPIQGDCENLILSTFTNLRYGVRAFNTNENKTIAVTNSKFENVITGIYLSGFNRLQLLSNEIEIKKIIIPNEIFQEGIYIEDCSGYHIEDNEIYSSYLYGYSSLIDVIGMYIKNSGPEDNEIYNNSLHNLPVGIIAEGVNKGGTTGLCIKCNTFDQNMNDALVWDTPQNNLPIPNLGIKYIQGSALHDTKAKAGNTFTFFQWPGSIEYLFGWNYLNTVEHFDYYHHFPQVNPLTYPYDYNYFNESSITRIPSDLLFIKDDACPSKIYEGGTPLKNYFDPKEMMDSAQVQIDLYQSQLNDLVDGGSTQELNNYVMMSMPDDALEVRQKLFDESPYLSDTVMVQAVNKENVLPGAMVRDVLVANPQAAKSKQVVDALDNRFDPLPDYMMGDIMQGLQQVGAKEILESKLASWHQYREFYKNELIWRYLTDTTMNAPYDSLTALYQMENNLDSRYHLAFVYNDNKQLSDALDVIDDIPGSFDMTDYQSTIYNDYHDYFDILNLMNDSGRSACQLDSASIDALFGIMDHGFPLISGYARGMLVKGDHLNYSETVSFPLLTQALTYPGPNFNNDEPEAGYLKLFPNPAWDYVIVEFDLLMHNSKGLLVMSDMNGRIIQMLEIPSRHNQLVLNLKDKPDGVYNFSLFVQNRQIDNKRVIITR